MSQKREEETLELKVPAEALTLCPENRKISSNSATTTTAISPASSSCTSQISDGSSSGPTKIGGNSSDEGGHRPEKSPEKQGVAAEVDREAPAKKEVNRCLGCKRRVGLTGFRCRCGELFCWEHRYSDRHDCSYDYKAAGRLAIARENPLVRAAKILKV
ncbi:hypothetical protein Nepgr_009435 [Nepenthes gracilis]|uniref:AN1-type domain-containing protein n=1 Tax=Nepenthes gracilis TaxID=150966 RepID=A0AAD3SAJ7_NEPGR|nr:hypothetical protein Nepgr_009435 [Nepenthes gracilis]